jgi:hypothetical protein
VGAAKPFGEVALEITFKPGEEFKARAKVTLTQHPEPYPNPNAQRARWVGVGSSWVPAHISRAAQVHQESQCARNVTRATGDPPSRSPGVGRRRLLAAVGRGQWACLLDQAV